MYDPFLYILPSEGEIEETRELLIQKIRSVDPLVGKKRARSGYEVAVYVLKNRIRDRKNLSLKILGEPYFATIALMAVDYLNGACDREMLLSARYE